MTGLVTVTALTEPIARSSEDSADASSTREISSIIVPTGTPGFTVSRKYSKVGWNASDTRELSFTDCRVPAANLLGTRGRGYAQFLRILDEGRIAIAALATGLAQGCVDQSIAYAGTRRAFGRTIGANQVIQFKLADMEMRAHTSRLAWRDAASRLLHSEPFKKEAAIAKLYSSEAGGGQRPGGHPDPRRLRLHERVPGRPHVARLQDPGDRGGHLRGPADADRKGVGHQLLTRGTAGRGGPPGPPPPSASVHTDSASPLRG
ncbi:hypothetical protein GCM10020229_42230 [Kitasatospora albolonga]